MKTEMIKRMVGLIIVHILPIDPPKQRALERWSSDVLRNYDILKYSAFYAHANVVNLVDCRSKVEEPRQSRSET